MTRHRIRFLIICRDKGKTYRETIVLEGTDEEIERKRAELLLRLGKIFGKGKCTTIKAGPVRLFHVNE